MVLRISGRPCKYRGVYHAVGDGTYHRAAEASGLQDCPPRPFDVRLSCHERLCRDDRTGERSEPKQLHPSLQAYRCDASSWADDPQPRYPGSRHRLVGLGGFDEPPWADGPQPRYPGSRHRPVGPGVFDEPPWADDPQPLYPCGCHGPSGSSGVDSPWQK